MNTAVTETARMLNPLSIAISNGIMRAIEKLIDVLNHRPRERVINDLAYALRSEYPRESDDYVMHMAVGLLKEYK